MIFLKNFVFATTAEGTRLGCPGDRVEFRGQGIFALSHGSRERTGRPQVADDMTVVQKIDDGQWLAVPRSDLFEIVATNVEIFRVEGMVLNAKRTRIRATSRKRIERGTITLTNVLYNIPQIAFSVFFPSSLLAYRKFDGEKTLASFS